MISPEAKLSKRIFTEDIKFKATRDGYGYGVLNAGEKNEGVVVLTGDLTESTRNHHFKERFPKRFIEVGVAEQNMAGIAAGLALEGKIPFMASYATFSPGRNWDQIRVSICYSKANVKIVGAHAGLSVGPDGATHQALEDIAITRVLPNLVVLSPADYNEAVKVTLAAAEYEGPVYIRLAREKTPIFTTKASPFEIGKAQILSSGTEVTIISTGAITYEALKAAHELNNKYGISCEVINCPTIKPLDKETILGSARKTGKVVTVEEHQVAGGLGGAISEFLSQTHTVPIKIIGIQDSFGESGKPEELLEKYGLSSNHIIMEVRNFI